MKAKIPLKLGDPIFSCSKCASRNTKAQSDTNGILGTLSNILKPLLQPSPLRGRVRVRCRDCGHEMLLMIL